MKKMIYIATLSLLALGSNVQAKENVAKNVEQQNKELDLIIKRLEDSGKLETALEKAIEKKIKKEKLEHDKKQLAQVEENNKKSQAIEGFSPKDHYLGDKNARYSMIVFEDLECPYCKVYANVPELVLNEVKNVNFVSRAHPLEFHMPMAAQQAVMAECVAEELGNEGYFKFTRYIFNNTLTNGKGIPPLAKDYEIKGTNKEKEIFNNLKITEKGLIVVAIESGIQDMEKTLNCYKDPKTSLKITNLLASSYKNGITGTPATILKDNVTGKSTMLSGALSKESLIQQLNNFIR